jgi:signal transduction histidine kinase
MSSDLESPDLMALVLGQNRALELALNGASLQDVLEVLARTAEAQADSNAAASILLLDDEGIRLHQGAAPSLPDEYNRAIDGVAIGPTVGSCGRSAYMRQTIVVNDIATDPLWKDFSGLALQHGLRACWSTPILASHGEKVLGTFAIYYREVCNPTPRLREVVDLLTRTAALAIERARERMQLEVKRRSIERLASDLRDAVRARDELLSVCGHELRTPVAAMKLTTQLFKRGFGRNDPQLTSREEVSRMIDQSDRQLDRLTRLIEDMLDFSRINAGRLEVNPERFGLAAMVGDVMTRLSPTLEAAGCRAKLDLDTSIEGDWDRFRLEQVLINLVTNASKYGAGRPVEVSLRRQGARAHLCVRDHGEGISREDRERIFRPYERAASAKNVSGLGLGLFIASRIVEAHRGELRLESELGAGATFDVSLPLVTRL